MNGFVYVWYDTKRKMYYIGSHNGVATDGYICSNKRMKAAYKKRPETFKRRIVEYVNSTDQSLILHAEQRWLDMIADNELSTSTNKQNGTVKYYNVKKTAAGGNGGIGSNGALTGKKKYYNPETFTQGLYNVGLQPNGWVLGVVPKKISSTNTMWIHNTRLQKNKRVISLSDELIVDGWVAGRLRTDTLLRGLSNGGKKAILQIDKSAPRPGRCVVTPLGEFTKIKHAALAHNTSSGTVWARLQNINKPDWHYKE